MSHPLSATLARCRDDNVEWEPLYDDLVARLRELGVGAGAPRVGDTLPPFALPNSRGLSVRSTDLIAAGPLVLSFNRGKWCPWCRSELHAWRTRLAELRAAGGTFVAVTGEIGGRAESMRQTAGLDAEVLCDIDHGVTLELGLAFPLSGTLRRRYLECGLDLAEAYGSASWFLPVPATFVIDRAGVVRSAFVEPDFRLRAEPDDVLAVVRSLCAESASACP